MIKFYYTPIPDGKKVAILLEEVGLPYELYPFNSGHIDYPLETLTTLSPDERGPIIIDPSPLNNEPPIRLCGSSAILIYLSEKTEKFISAKIRDKYSIIQWVLWLENKLIPTLESTQYFSHRAEQIVPYAIELYHNETIKLYNSLNLHLQKNIYLAGETYSIADIAAYPLIHDYEKQRINLQDYPFINNWYRRISNRQAVEQAMHIQLEQQNE